LKSDKLFVDGRTDGRTFPPLMLLGRLLEGVDLKTRESGTEYRQQDRLRGRLLTSVNSSDACATKYQPLVQRCTLYGNATHIANTT